MKKHATTIILFFLLLLSVTAYGQSQSYYSRNDFLMTSPGVMHDGLIGFANPANLGLLKGPEFHFHWSTDGVDATSFNNWGVFTGTHRLGFGVLNQEFGDYQVRDYQLSLGFGNQADAFGIAYSFSSGDIDQTGRERMLIVGNIRRPCRYISCGLLSVLSLESSWKEAVAEIGIRPLGSSLLTLFADGSLEKDMKLSDMPWSAGVAVEAVPGLNLVGRYFDNKSFTVGFTFNFGKERISGQSHYDTDQKLSQYSYSAQIGGDRSSFVPALFEKDKKYMPLNMKGLVDYNKYVFFDNGTLRFMDIIKDIRAAVDDPRISAIAMNLSGMRIYPEHAWEIREELRKAKEAGIKVIIFIDNAGMKSYHLASIADAVVLDPEGSIELPGYIMGSTYFKGTIAKLGLAFDEWRFFKYKSAAEALSRDRMSDADAEQRQDFVDDMYELVRSDICRGRGLSPEKFDSYIDEHMYFMPDDALKAGLVDTLARWSDKSEIIENLTGKNLGAISSDKLFANTLPQQNWGELPIVALVYGLGVCSMDHGIKARQLERVFQKLASDKSIKAIVFRVDSPGGDGMASDLVAEAIKKCAEEKPVIISQGQVAGSGGYWISMYGDTIVAGPNTITGSIGVIGGWIYDKGLSDKLGMTSDYVKRGEHADLGFGITLPFLGIRVPARNLTEEERGKMEEIIKKFYDIFVGKVATGRDMPVDDIKKIAEGHFYSGIDGKEIGLVDEIGGLITAMEIAKEKAGLKPQDEIKIIEIPKSKGLFNISQKLSPISTRLESDLVYQYLKMFSKHPGHPLPMLLPGTYPVIE